MDGKGKPTPLFFHDVAIRNGVLNCEVPENDKVMLSSHIQPPLNKGEQVPTKSELVLY